MQGSGSPFYGPETPLWLRPGAPTTCPAESGRVDKVVVLVLITRSPVDPKSVIKGTLYGIDGVLPGYIGGRRPWVDEAGPSEACEEDLRFPTFVDLMLCHGGSTELAADLLRSIKVRSKEELQY